MDMRTPPLNFKIMLESTPPKSRILVGRLGISSAVPADRHALGVRGFDSNGILILRGGILMSIANVPESLSQRILAQMILVGILGVSPGCMSDCTNISRDNLRDNLSGDNINRADRHALGVGDLVLLGVLVRLMIMITITIIIMISILIRIIV